MFVEEPIVEIDEDPQYFTLWRKFPQFPQFPKPENQGFSTVPDYQSFQIVPIFGSMLHF